MNLSFLVQITYIVASILFAFGLKFLSSPVTARRGNLLSSTGMLLAVLATLAGQHVIGYQWILLGLVIGAVCGTFVALRAAMTQMPEMIALLHGCGALASVFVDWVHYEKLLSLPVFAIGMVEGFALFLSIVIGALTFTGSIIAWGKLSERLPGRPILFAGQQWLNFLILVGIIASGVMFLMHPQQTLFFYTFLALSALFGVLLVIPIGGADMPVVISVLNSYSGIVACTTGFVINNTLLIVVGALVGANGIILSIIMCKAMNRSLVNVIFGGFGQVQKKKLGGEKKTAQAISVEDAQLVLEAAKTVIFAPGYGMAVAQAQHAVRELTLALERNGCEVKFAIHPVAGRMPGHMNVLLAEANIPYDQLLEMEEANPLMESTDVAIVIGANDTVNPAALNDKTSPIFGMPIVEVFKARTVFVIKRSMASGFAGVENELFYYDNTRMIFGDAKDIVQKLVAEFKAK
ncbi:MAG: NAD(P)(+) transhydrogenase (Re/Si-specific) subunit beta [Candidatus Omnitrophica bacterium]|nr:NAD(P)(+) transhydrogenase (Re/Si-specific) subunit beta [Candidatus Omnitrophota bacterium]